MAINVADQFQYLGKKSLDARVQYATLAAMKAVTDANINEGCFAYCVETDKYYTFKSTNTVDATLGKWREYGVEEMPSEDMADVITPLPSARPAYHKYSTEEQVVGEWVDGGKIYERTFVNPTLVDTTPSGKGSSKEAILIDSTNASNIYLLEGRGRFINNSNPQSIRTIPLAVGTRNIDYTLQELYMNVDIRQDQAKGIFVFVSRNDTSPIDISVTATIRYLKTSN